MAHLHLTLLGGFRAQLDDGAAVGVSIKKAQALLAYLAVPLGRAHPRDKLAALLWGEMGDSQARAGLRHTLFTLRKALPGISPLRLEGETVALDADIVRVDVDDFARCAAEESAADLERAAALYQGDLLEGLALQEAPFEDWLISQRLRLRELALDALARLLARQREAGTLEAAVQTGLQLVALDPIQEPVHRTVMRLYVDLGRRGAALRQYQACVGALQRELRAEPEEETKALYRHILQRSPGQPAPAAPPRRDRAPVAPRHPPSPAAGLSTESPLVGRAAELRQLADALESACAGRGQLVAVIGEAGIGKSRLAAELLVEAGRTGGRVLVGRCHESEQVLPFGPWIDALRSGRLTEEDAILQALGPAWRLELARLLPEIAGDAAGPSTSDPTQLFEAVAQMLERAASARPVILLLEDLHWADEMSLRLLAFIGRRLPGWSMLALATAREELLPDATPLRRTLDELDQSGHLTRCPLAPLGRRETMALARTIVLPAVAAQLGDALWRASEGNPFMVVETLRALRGARASEVGPALPLPERVRALIASRIERLGDRSRRLVAVAALIGRPFDFTLLARAADIDEAQTAEGVEELVRHRLLQAGDGGVEFTHDRIREVAAGELLAPRRALIHRAVAEAIESLHATALDPHAWALGSHYRDGQVWAKAVLYLAQAGRQATLRYAQRDAVACYEQALTALAHLPESNATREQEADLRFRLAHALYLLGDFARSTAFLREAEALGLTLGDRRRVGEVYGSMAYLLGSEGDFAGAIQAGLRALTIATSIGYLNLEVWTSIGLGRVYYGQGDLRRAIERIRWVTGALADAPVDAPIDEHFGRGSLLPAVACRAWLSLCLAGTGDFAEAFAWGGEGLRIAREVGGPPEQVWAAYCLSRVHLARGDAESAMPLLEAALPLCEGRLPIYRPRIVASLGRAFTMRGDLAAALPLLEQAVAGVEAVKLLFGHPVILVWTAAAHLEAGRLAEAEGYASAALDLARRQGGRGDEAWALHALAEIGAHRAPPAPELALDRATQALARAEELAMAPLQARCHLSLAALLRQAGRVEEARDELTRATAMLGHLQMRHWMRGAHTSSAD